MSERGALTVFEAESGEESGLGAQIRSLGYVCRCFGPDELAEAAAAGGIVVVDAALGPEVLTRSLPEDTDEAAFRPVILAGTPEQVYGADIAEQVRAGRISLCVTTPFHRPQFDNAIKSLARLANIQDEFRRRAEVLAGFGRAMDGIPDSRELHGDRAGLLVAGSGRYYQSIRQALGDEAVIAGALTPALAMDRLAEGDIAALVIDMSAEEFSSALDFIRRVRRDARYFHLPIVLIPRAGNSDMDDVFYTEGVSDIVAAPFTGHHLLISVLPLMGIARFREALKASYAEARRNPVADALTGLYSRGVFLTHMQRMISDKAGFSVALMTVDNIAAINAAHGYAGGDRILRQIGEAIELLTRGEDLAARFSGAEFAVLMPGTSEDAARAGLRRILSVLRYTSFSPGLTQLAVEVEFEGAAAEAQPGETPEHVMHRVKSLYRTSCVS